MEHFRRSKEHWGIVEIVFTEPARGTTLTNAETKVLDEQRLKNLKAKNYLFQAIDHAILETILKKDNAKDIWEPMKKKYRGTERVKCVKLQALRKEFEILYMKKGESSKDIDSLSIDELQSSLLVYEPWMTSHVVEEQALKVNINGATSLGRGKGCGGFRGRGRGRGRVSTHNQQYDKANVECYHCHKLGDVWYLDFRCSNHMSGNKFLFSKLDENFRENIKLGNNANIYTITGVFYVLELKSNLISLGHLQEDGFSTITQRGMCQIHNSEKGCIARVIIASNLKFPLETKTQLIDGACYASTMKTQHGYGTIVSGI
ncbi:uncharacterized protein LOC111390145 [Olea europaea var. sylvestris]|uniref:uncharacterized protein LOC111390145 n=1 Tax=Olea europaea var. sylvestris TaxID=158386 RepID=UPI000C1D3495|nr:uncharacterized protein LOC111390145 [Olea europaea var. sylvestris]